MKCRFCKHELSYEFVDLVNAPPSNSFLTMQQLKEPEVFYPLRLFVCDSCFLVQIDEYKKSVEIFDANYIYFSSYSRSWLEHAKQYVNMIVERFNLNQTSQIIEIASNDGYLLQYFQDKDIPCLGIEPTEGTAHVAKEKGIKTIIDFFGVRLARNLVEQNKKADLLIGNNVLAHVPDLNDFVAGLKIALKPNGVITMEFPHLMQLIDNCQFDTIYHEHFSYLSFFAVKAVFEKYGLTLFDVDKITTHGGSLRIYAKHNEDYTKNVSNRVSKLIDEEIAKGINNISYYQGFQNKVDNVKYNLLAFLIRQKKMGKKVVAYGAAAKGNSLINYCGIKRSLISFAVDISPYKLGKYLPGSHIPVINENELKEYKPEYVLILPWNIKDEIIMQLDYIRDWNGKFVIAIPEMKIF